MVKRMRGFVRLLAPVTSVAALAIGGLIAPPAGHVTGVGALATAASNSGPCPRGSAEACASTDPRWAISWYSEGDTTSCTWQNMIDWGDGTHLTQTVSGKAATGDLITTDAHVYQRRGSYTITFTSQTLAGSCSAGDYTWQFALKKLTTEIWLAALGDSYSSGEGAGDYLPGTGGYHGCDRSRHAWSLLLDTFSAAHDVQMRDQNLIACSGATSTELYEEGFKDQQAQDVALRSLRPAPAVVTLTMGGNDVDFSGVLSDCYVFDCISDGKLAATAAEIRDVEKKTLAEDYNRVLRADPSATLLVVGYPRIFEQDHWCGGNPKLHLGFSVAELKELNQLGNELDTAIAAAAAEDAVSYVPVTNALAGHELCTKDPWLYDVGLSTSWTQQAGHPTQPGQEAIAKVVAAYIDQHL